MALHLSSGVLNVIIRKLWRSSFILGLRRLLMYPVFNWWWRHSVLYVDATASSTTQDGRSLPPKPENTVRFVVISDTHGRHEDLTLPRGDVLVHCGDILLANHGLKNASVTERAATISQLRAFNSWLGRQSFGDKSNRIVVGGNHDGALEELGAEEVQRILSNATYLENQEHTLTSALFEDVRIYGSPHSNVGPSQNRAFQIEAGSAKEAEAERQIPDGISVLVTHGEEGLFGKRIHALFPRPHLHLFGHLHYGYGVRSSGGIVRINASSCDEHLCAVHPPVVVDLVRSLRSALDCALPPPSEGSVERKPWVCDTCGKAFGSRQLRDLHCRRCR